MRKFNICDAHDLSIIHGLASKATSLLKYEEPLYEELNEDGRRIQKQFGIEKVPLFKSSFEAIKALRELEERYALKGYYVEEFIPREWIQFGFKECFEKYSFHRNEINLEFLAFLAGVLQSIKGSDK